MLNSPKISIITIVWNDCEGMVRTLDSVRNQTFRDFEYIVVDGASTDGTREFLECHEAQIDFLISEPDNGLYEAMNKGAGQASGAWALFLNAGDVLATPETLARTFAQIDQNNTVYFGRAIVEFTGGGGWIYPPRCISTKTCKYWLRINLPNHQAMFFPRSFYQSNRYRLDLKISADSDYKERAIAAKGYRFLDQAICRFALDGVSSERTLRSQIRQVSDRFNRLPVPKNYVDFPISVAKSFVRYGSYRLLGNTSHLIIHWLKSRVDCARANVRYWTQK